MFGSRETMRAAFSLAAAGVAISLLAACSSTGGSALSPNAAPQSVTPQGVSAPAAGTKLKFQTIDDNADPTFNQLLGINNNNEICGYFGNGLTAQTPNKGYTIVPPYGQSNFTNENFPGSVQTQVTAINQAGQTAGFGIGPMGKSFGWIDWNNAFVQYKSTTQILGMNDNGTAVGFVTHGKKTEAFSLDRNTGKLTMITPPGGSNPTAAAINNSGDITGFFTVGKATKGWLLKGGAFTVFSYPNSSTTTPLGINIHDEIVGAYVDGNGMTHGFTLKTPVKGATFASYDDPKGIGSTTFNGLNDKGVIVGFYGPTPNNTHGLLAKP